MSKTSCPGHGLYRNHRNRLTSIAGLLRVVHSQQRERAVRLPAVWDALVDTSTTLTTTQGAYAVWHQATWVNGLNGQGLNGQALYLDGVLVKNSSTNVNIGASTFGTISAIPNGTANGLLNGASQWKRGRSRLRGRRGHLEFGAPTPAQVNAIYQVPHQFQSTGLDTGRPGATAVGHAPLFNAYAAQRQRDRSAARLGSTSASGLPGGGTLGADVGRHPGRRRSYYVQLDASGGGVETTAFPSRARWRCWRRAWPVCSATPGGSGGRFAI